LMTAVLKMQHGSVTRVSGDGGVIHNT